MFNEKCQDNHSPTSKKRNILIKINRHILLSMICVFSDLIVFFTCRVALLCPCSVYGYALGARVCQT